MQKISCKTYRTKVITQCVVTVYQNEIFKLRHLKVLKKQYHPKGGTHERKQLNDPTFFSECETSDVEYKPNFKSDGKQDYCLSIRSNGSVDENGGSCGSIQCKRSSSW